MNDGQTAQYSTLSSRRVSPWESSSFCFKGSRIVWWWCTVGWAEYRVPCAVYSECPLVVEVTCCSQSEPASRAEQTWCERSESRQNVSASQLQQQTDGGQEGQESRQEIPDDVAEERNAEAEEHPQCRHLPPLRGGSGPDGGPDLWVGGEADISDPSSRTARQDGRDHGSDGDAVGLQHRHDEGGGGPHDDNALQIDDVPNRKQESSIIKFYQPVSECTLPAQCS